MMDGFIERLMNQLGWYRWCRSNDDVECIVLRPASDCGRDDPFMWLRVKPWRYGDRFLYRFNP